MGLLNDITTNPGTIHGFYNTISQCVLTWEQRLLSWWLSLRWPPQHSSCVLNDAYERIYPYSSTFSKQNSSLKRRLEHICHSHFIHNLVATKTNSLVCFVGPTKSWKSYLSLYLRKEREMTISLHSTILCFASNNMADIKWNTSNNYKWLMIIAMSYCSNR